MFSFYLFLIVFCALCCFQYRSPDSQADQLWYAFTDILDSPWDTENIDLDLDNLTLSCKVEGVSFDTNSAILTKEPAKVDDELAPPTDNRGTVLNYKSWTLAQLRERAYQEGIPHSKLRKADLIAKLEARDNARLGTEF